MPLLAQRHGGGGSAHLSSSHGFATRSSGAFRGGSPHGGSFGSGIRVGSGYRYGVRGTYGRLRYYSYSYYPYLDDYGWYADSSDDQTADSYADVYGPPLPYREDSGLQRDVQGLSNKIDHLQADVEARNHAKTEQEPETALVFRDKHVEEVRNYAISGGTLWVLTDNAAKRIPLAQLDIDATVKVNDDRGVDFQVPQPSLQLMIVR